MYSKIKARPIVDKLEVTRVLAWPTATSPFLFFSLHSPISVERKLK